MRSLDSLDPQRAADSGALLLARSRFRGLTTLDEQGAVELALADDVKSRRNGRVFEFRLREDAVFSNGSQVVAADVIATLERAVRSGTRSPHAYLLDMVKGFDALRDGSAKNLAGLTSENRRTIVFTLVTPFFDLPAHLSHPALGILPRGSLSKDFGPKTPASGPFVLNAYSSGESAELVRNKRSVGVTSYVEELEFKVVSDGARSLRNDAIDVAYLQTPDPSRLSPRWGTLSLGVNLRNIATAKERRIIQSALDRDALVDGSGEPWLPMSRLVPDGLIADVEPVRGGAAKWTRSRPLRLAHLDDESSTRFAARVAEQFRSARIKIALVPVARDRYADVLASFKHDLVQLGWLTEIPSADGFLARQLGTGSLDNQTGFSDRQFDQLITKARDASGSQDREAAYAAAERRALAQAALIPVIQLGVGFDGSPFVRGVILDGSGTFDATTAWFAPRDSAG